MGQSVRQFGTIVENKDSGVLCNFYANLEHGIFYDWLCVVVLCITCTATNVLTPFLSEDPLAG